jgi:inhibitor of KinA
MRIDPLGDVGFILRDLPCPAYEAAAALSSAGLAGVDEAVASYETVGVFGDPAVMDLSQIPAALTSSTATIQTHHRIPVCYEMGEDLEEVARRLGIPSTQVVDLHSETTYTCFAVGFSPGFPYLGYLPEPLTGVPRRAEPRVRVEPGSVAITGKQTGIYPSERPGGWAILGRTPLALVDVEDGFFPIQAGDTVSFVPIGMEEYHARKGERLG